MKSNWMSAVSLLMLGTLVLFGCTKLTPERALEAQVARGMGLYEKHCASCHDGSPPYGGLITRELLASYRTAYDLGQYVWHEMPDNAPGSLGVHNSYDIVAYLLVLNDLGNLTEPLTLANDESILLAEEF